MPDYCSLLASSFSPFIDVRLLQNYTIKEEKQRSDFRKTLQMKQMLLYLMCYIQIY